MKVDTTAALFLMLGQAANKTVLAVEDLVPRKVAAFVCVLRLGGFGTGQGA